MAATHWLSRVDEQVAWMKEEPPLFESGECQRGTTYGSAEIITALEQQQIRPYVPLPDFD